jgi:hypothetical protein
MNVFRNKFVLFFISILILLVLPLKTFAQNKVPEKQIVATLAKDQIINHDYFAVGEKVTIDGTINGDAYIAGGQITINGIINGDLLVAGGQIIFRGKAIQDIRVVGGTISIEGEVGKNISLVGGNITIGKDAKIAGNTVIAGGMAVLSSDISGNVIAGVGTLELTSGAIINGNLDYWSNDKAIIASEAKVLQPTTFHQTNFNIPQEQKKTALSGAKTFFNLIGFISSLLIGMLYIYLLPIFSQKIADTVRNKFWLSLLVGFVSIIAAPIAGIILFSTVIGTPITMALIFISIIIIYVSKIVISLAIGKVIGSMTKKNIAPVWGFALGLVLYYLISLIPIIGNLMKIIALFVGVGAIVIQEKSYFTTLRAKKTI